VGRAPMDSRRPRLRGEGLLTHRTGQGKLLQNQLALLSGKSFASGNLGANSAQKTPTG